jgi:hypothetical protein
MVTCKMNRQIMLSDKCMEITGAYMSKFDFRQRSIFIVNGNTLHSIECGVLSVYYLTKNSVF